MADEIKPPVSGSTTSPFSPAPSPSGPTPPLKATGGTVSPLTPDIKIPSNLPTKDIGTPLPVIQPLPTKPATPAGIATASPKPSSPPPPPVTRPTFTPPLASTASKPASPPPVLGSKPITPLAQPEQSSIFKSSIRTMQEDLAALKKGQTPAGFQIEKQSEKEIKPTEPTIPQSALRPQISSHVELGRLEKSKPITIETQKGQGMQKPTIPAPPSVGPAKPAINIPSAGGLLNRLGGLGSKKMFLWGGIGLLAVVSIVLIFTLKPSEPEVTFTPTPSITIVPTVPAVPFIETVFDLYSSVAIAVGPDVFEQLSLVVNKDALAGGEAGLYKIVFLPPDGQNYSFNSFVSGALVTVPEELKSFINQDTTYLSLLEKNTGDFSHGFVVKLKTDIGISQSLSRWEANMAINFKNLFSLDVAKAASVGFLDNTYQGVTIRYLNFPDPFKTIDYAVVTVVNGDKYLIFTNSREHIYAIIDNLR